MIDNCEHVLGAVGRLIGEILRWCPGVRVLATSREALDMSGEVVWNVAPLALPVDPGASPDALRTSPAVQVFVNRATGAAPGFSLGERNARAVAELCIQLDGVPLALELAAARMGSLSADQLLDRIHERFSLLSQGPAVDARHRTLHDLVQWSFELLSPPSSCCSAGSRCSPAASTSTPPSDRRRRRAWHRHRSSRSCRRSSTSPSSSPTPATGPCGTASSRRSGASAPSSSTSGPRPRRVRRAHRSTFAALAEAAERGPRRARRGDVVGPPRPGDRQPAWRACAPP